MKRIEFTISGEDGKSLGEPRFVENCSELLIAAMRAMKDFIEAHDGGLDLPITILLQLSPASPNC